MAARTCHRIWLVIPIILLVFLLSACSENLGLPTTISSYPVDSVFREFYSMLGGQGMLGPAISVIEEHQDLQCQYTERALMCYNPAITDETRYRLYPLGPELGIQPDRHLANSTSGERLVDGIAIYEKFQPLYDRLYGARYVGKPLTELRINQDLQRVEQYFENVGFFQALNDPNGPVALIPYGAYKCTGHCSAYSNELFAVIKANSVEQPFGPAVARLGGPSAVGAMLLKPQTDADGSIQQLSTNVMFSAPGGDISQARLLPLPQMLGYQVQPLTAQNVHPQLVFYEISDGLGHNVPKPFDTFIALHGGWPLAGIPTSEVVELAGQKLYEQCFENYCLLYDPSATDALKVRMAPLGQEYLTQHPAPEEAQIRNDFSPESIALTISADKPSLNDNETQTIRVSVQQVKTAKPLERVEASLLISTPGKPQARTFLPPTDANGLTQAAIPPQPDLSNGTRLVYQVCLNLPSDQPICAQESYLIWNVR